MIILFKGHSKPLEKKTNKNCVTLPKMGSVPGTALGGLRVFQIRLTSKSLKPNALIVLE